MKDQSELLAQIINRINKLDNNFEDYKKRNEKLYLENDKLIDDLKSKMTMQKGHINKCVAQVETISSKKASKKELKELVERMDAFSELEHMNYLKETLLPKMSSFGDNVDGFMKELDDVKICTRSYDEVLNTKANKIELNICRQELESSFITNLSWDKIKL